MRNDPLPDDEDDLRRHQRRMDESARDTTPDSIDRRQLFEWMEAAQRPQSPLSNTELTQLRSMLDEFNKAAWFRRKLLLYTPVVITVFSAIGSGIWFLWSNLRGGPPHP